MTDPKPARAAREQTFEEAQRQYLALDPSISSAQLSVWEHGWYARDRAMKHLEERLNGALNAETLRNIRISVLEERIAELECQVGIEQKGAIGLLDRIERVRALVEEFDNLTILGSDEKKAGYEAAMRTAVNHLRAALCLASEGQAEASPETLSNNKFVEWPLPKSEEWKDVD